MKILVTVPQGEVRDTFLPPHVCSMLEALGEVTYNDLGRQYTSEELQAALYEKDVLVIGWGSPLIGGKVLEGNNTLRLVVHTGGSVADYVDHSTYEKGIRVICGNKMFAESVAEGTIAYMLTVLRRIPDQIEAVRHGEWRTPENYLDEGLLGKQIGILGVGTIARFLMEKLQSFRCSFLVWDDNYTVDPAYLSSVNARQTTLEEVMRSCKIVSVHAALTPKTRGMIGGRELEMMPQGGIFINTSRGAIIREEEMIEVLQRRGDLRAMLDVFEKEPLDADSPLRRLRNVYIMPHRGGPTVDFRSAIGEMLVREISRVMAGLPSEHEIVEAVAARMTAHRS